MSIWLLAIVLLVVCGALGLLVGALRAFFLLFGVILGLALGSPLGAALKGLIASAGVKNPLYMYLLPPVPAFLIITLVLFGAGFFVHYRVVQMFKMRRSEYDFLTWQDMNRKVGVFVGVAIASVLFLVTCRVIYPMGYLTYQVSTEESANPAWIKFLSSARHDMKELGLDRAVASMDRTPPAFFQGADILGLIYHNPALQARLANYPYFLGLGQRSEFQEMGADKDYNDLIFGKASVGAFIDHARTQALFNNSEVLNEIKGVDLKDLRTYLETGKSPKYDEEKILGFWTLDKDAVLLRVRKMAPEMKASDLTNLKKSVEALPGVEMLSLLGGKANFKVTALPAAPVAAVAAPVAAPQPVEDPKLTQRYGPLRRGTRPAETATILPAKPAAPVAPPIISASGEGTWKPGDLGGYEVSIPGSNGKPVSFLGKIEDDELILTKDNQTLIFTRN